MYPDYEVFMVDRHATDSAKTRLVTRWLNDTTALFKKDGCFTPIRFGVRGYDTDPRPLFQVPEVRAWSQELFTGMPDLFLYLDTCTIKWLFLAIAEIEISHNIHKEPEGLFGDLYSRLGTEEKAILKKMNPCMFTCSALWFGPTVNALIDTIYDTGIKEIRKSGFDDEITERLMREFGDRLLDGLPKWMNATNKAKRRRKSLSTSPKN
jgi:hypothetical protein